MADLRLETERLVLVEVEEADLDGLLEVALSHPGFTWAEVLAEHPGDRVPWIGLLEIHHDAQRQGYGREAVQALIGWARGLGAPALRLGVDDGNAAGLAFWQRLGFRAVDRRDRRGPGGHVRVTVLELQLDE